jgi:class 3 adenylate cyclase
MAEAETRYAVTLDGVHIAYQARGALAAFFAASYPDRVAALVLVNGWARAAPQAWRTMPSSSAVRRSGCDISSPGAALEFYDAWYAIDVRAILGAIQAPTLMIARPDASGSVGDPVPGAMIHMAEHIPGARYVGVPGRDYAPWLGDSNRIIVEIEEFLRAQRAEQAEFDRVLATLLFTDVVGSTERDAEMGDRSWRELLEPHHQVVRAMLGRYRGVEVSTAGDGFFATFDGPARAVRCAQAIVAAVRPLGIEIRAGVHTGEIEYMGDNVGGMAVHIGARVGALAGPSEVLVSGTVHDLVVGSGLELKDHGVQKLKGVPGEWRLYRATA